MREDHRGLYSKISWAFCLQGAVIVLCSGPSYAGTVFSNLSKTTRIMTVGSSSVSQFDKKQYARLMEIKKKKKDKHFVILETIAWMNEISDHELIKKGNYPFTTSE